MGKMIGLPDRHGVADHGGTTGGTYEFDQLQNHTFRDLARAMRFVGVITVLSSIVFAVSAVFAIRRGHAIGTIVAGVEAAINLVLGGYLINAAAHCQRIVETQGQDIRNLMAGLDQLRRYFRLQMILMIIAICMIGAGLILYLTVL